MYFKEFFYLNGISQLTLASSLQGSGELDNDLFPTSQIFLKIENFHQPSSELFHFWWS